jgi:hypothetical protein
MAELPPCCIDPVKNPKFCISMHDLIYVSFCTESTTETRDLSPKITAYQITSSGLFVDIFLELRERSRVSTHHVDTFSILHRLEEERRSFSVVLFYEAPVGQHWCQMVSKNAPIHGNQVSSLGGFHKLLLF